MRITTPEEFRAARAARIEAERLAIEREQAAIEARAQEIVADFDKRLAAGDDVFGRGSALLIADDARVGALVEETLVTNGWRAVSDREPDDYSVNLPRRKRRGFRCDVAMRSTSHDAEFLLLRPATGARISADCHSDWCGQYPYMPSDILQLWHIVLNPDGYDCRWSHR